MRVQSLLTASLVLFCGFVAGAQTIRPADKCTGDCCKKEKQAAKPAASIKQTIAMETITAPKTIACKLTSAELQKRKEAVIESLKKQVMEKHELKDGYRYKFPGADTVFDELTTFIKTERQCCDFFTFELAISGDHIWLSITGPEGAKEFIRMEMDL
jgi:hypothetical protein